MADHEDVTGFRSRLDSGVALRLAGVAVGLICLGGLFGSIATSDAPPGTAPVTGLSAWLLSPVSTLMGIIGAVFLFIVGAFVSASRREHPS